MIEKNPHTAADQGLKTKHSGANEAQVQTIRGVAFYHKGGQKGQEVTTDQRKMKNMKRPNRDKLFIEAPISALIGCRSFRIILTQQDIWEATYPV